MRGNMYKSFSNFVPSKITIQNNFRSSTISKINSHISLGAGLHSDMNSIALYVEVVL